MTPAERQEIHDAFKSHLAAIADLEQTALLIVASVGELARRLQSLEAQLAIHDIALYPEGHPPIKE